MKRENWRTESLRSVWESSERFSVPQRAPDSLTTHWGAGLCGERTGIVAAVTGQAAIVQLPLWDWLRHAGPPYDLNTHTHTDTHIHTPFETFLTCFPMVILSQTLSWCGRQPPDVLSYCLPESRHSQVLRNMLTWWVSVHLKDKLNQKNHNFSGRIMTIVLLVSGQKNLCVRASDTQDFLPRSLWQTKW